MIFFGSSFFMIVLMQKKVFIVWKCVQIFKFPLDSKEEMLINRKSRKLTRGVVDNLHTDSNTLDQCHHKEI